jgi:hypothetical protein
MRLLTLPLRLPFKLVKGALSLLQGSPEVGPTPTRKPPQPRFRREPRQAREPRRAPTAEAVEPAHVSEEPELVAAVAERGAEQGAGPEIHVDEPWPGYGGMTAADIRDRLRAEGPVVASAVRLYEAAHKGRSSVLEAAGRELSAPPSG